TPAEHHSRMHEYTNSVHHWSTSYGAPPSPSGCRRTQGQQATHRPIQIRQTNGSSVFIPNLTGKRPSPLYSNQPSFVFHVSEQQQGSRSGGL
ncbi:hypothetical protein ACLOJK_019734, partial [Asimina triloba]